MKFFYSAALVASATPSSAAPAPAQLRSPQENAPANRRGLAYNDVGLLHFFDTDSSKVGWKYNWAHWDGGSSGTPPTWEFVPMLHSDRKDHTNGWFSAIDKCFHVGPASAQYPTHVLGFNEPDLCGSGGACMQDTGKAVAAWRAWIEPLRKYGDRIKLGSPAVTNAAAPWGLTWLKAFIQQCGGCQIDFINIHWYDSASNTAYFKKHIQDARAVARGRPIWITEFGPGGSDEEIRNFLNEILPWLDSQPDVHRYAMQMVAAGSLVNTGSNGLSAIGHTYNTI